MNDGITIHGIKATVNSKNLLAMTWKEAHDAQLKGKSWCTMCQIISFHPHSKCFWKGYLTAEQKHGELIF